MQMKVYKRYPIALQALQIEAHCWYLFQRDEVHPIEQRTMPRQEREPKSDNASFASA